MVVREEGLQRIGNLMDSQGLGVLATGGKGGPHTSLVAFAHTMDLGRLVFGTTRASRKYSNMVEDPRVAMLIDDRRNDASDLREAIAVTAYGTAREPEGGERQGLLDRLIGRHAQLEEFASSPTVAIMVIDVRTYILVSRFQKVLELRMKG